MPASAHRRSPYQGLLVYEAADAPYFFGREKETRLIIANLFAAPLTLLYGASGVGKSSVLRAGVTHQLAPREDVLIASISTWQSDPLVALRSAVAEALGRATGKVPPRNSEPLATFLTDCAERCQRRLMIILDQFEEYFLYYPKQDPFDAELSSAVMHPEAPASFLISIREDCLAKLDRFEGRIPTLFSNYLRIEHLDRNAARAAITKPLDRYHRLYADSEGPASIEPLLIEEILRQVETGQVILGESGAGFVKLEEREVRIETPYLQLILTRLWNEESAAGSRILMLDTLSRLGGASRVVRTHLDAAMAGLPPPGQEVAARIFHYLVTPSGTKIAHTVDDLAEYAGLERAQLVPVMLELAGGDVRILRPVAPPLDQPDQPRYEIFHDVLAAPVLDWRTRYVQEQRQAEARRLVALEAERRVEAERQLIRERSLVNRQRWFMALLAILLVTAAALTIYAFQKRNDAERASAEAELERRKAAAERDTAVRARQEAEAANAAARSAAEAAQASATDARKQERRAEDSLQEARAAQLTTKAMLQLEVDPELSVLLAVEAARLGRLPAAEDIFRAALAHLSRLRLALRGHTAQVMSADFSRDGKWVVTASQDGTATVWEAATGAAVSVLRGHTGGVRRAAFSPDGTWVVTGGLDGTARIWDAATGKSTATLKADAVVVSAAEFDPAGRMVVIASGSRARIWEVPTGRLIAALTGHTAPVNTANFSPDGRWVLTASGHLVPPSDDTARVWDATTGKLIAQMGGEGGMIYDAGFSPDGTRVVTASRDGVARVWAANTGERISVLRGHDSVVNRAEFSRDGRLVLTASFDGTARIWTPAGRSVATLQGHQGPLTAATFSPDAKFVVTGSRDNTARLWEAGNGSLVAVLRGHTQLVSSAMFSPNGNSVLTAGDTTARLWVAGHRLPVTESQGRWGRVLRAAFSPDGRRLIAVGSDNVPRVWETATQTSVAELRGVPGSVSAVVFSPDGRRVVTGSQYGTAAVWELPSGNKVSELRGHSAIVNSASFSSDAKSVITTSGDRTARVWDAATGRSLAQFAGHAASVVSASLDPKGSRAVTAGLDGKVILWDVASGKRLAELPAHERYAASVAFSPDGRHIVSAGGDRIARVWDIGAATTIAEMKGHTDPVTRAAFSPDGKFVVTAGNDGTLRIWGTATGLSLDELPRSEWVWPSAGPNRNSLLAVTPNGTLRTYVCEVCVPIEDLLALARKRVTRELSKDERDRYLRP